MEILRFRIGDGFPAGLPLARFIAVLGMISNDWLRSTEDLLKLDDADVDDADRPARRVALFRQQAALHHEAVLFLVNARKRFPEIDELIDSLPLEAQEEYDRVVGAVDPSSEHYLGDWFREHRNVTFHYPEMHPEKSQHGAEEITEALRAAADLECGQMEGGRAVASISASSLRYPSSPTLPAEGRCCPGRRGFI